MDKKKRFKFNLEIFKDIFKICPRVQGQDFNALPTDEEIVYFLRELGHTREINLLNDVVVDHMRQPWRTFIALINKSLSRKTISLDKLRLSKTQILWGMYHQKNMDYVELLWEDFIYQIDNKAYKKQENMYYPRFTKVIIHYFLTQDMTLSWRNKIGMHTSRDDYLINTLRFVSTKEETQIYGAILPESLTTSPKLTTVPESTGKSKRVKTPAKKSIEAPTRGVTIRETPKNPLSKKKEKVDVTRDDSNNEQDSSGEDSDQENDSDDDKTQSDNENESDFKHETVKIESVDTDKGFVQEECTDAAMTNVQQGNENPVILQVIKDAHMVKESVKDVVLAKESSQPQSLYEAGATLTEFEIKKSCDLDKTIFSTYGKVKSLKRSKKDCDEDPFTGSDRGLKKRKTSKDAEPAKGPKAKESQSGSSKGNKSESKSFRKSVQSEEPEFEVADLDMLQDQEENPGNEELKKKVASKLTGLPHLHNLKNLLILIGMLARLHNKDKIKDG
uniref:Monodehydroascorbate reductase n=1 Tax=Tanacetum cinerariifolium TaxID=118510 RepID=A0A699HT54_TANCI|nr:hypothetical protein [Tanacetum cinerariifolium]